jgi:hypothetical protein
MVYTGIMPPADVQVELELASEGKLESLRVTVFVTPDGDYMDRILGCGPAGLRRGRGPLGKCSSCAT